jgi:hypothetical protein
MWKTMLEELKSTPASSEIGRLAQLLKAAGLTKPELVSRPEGPDPGSDAALEEASRIDGTRPISPGQSGEGEH